MPATEEDIVRLRAAYEAMRSGDANPFSLLMDENIRWIGDEGISPPPPECNGREEASEVLRRAVEGMPARGIESVSISGDRILAVARWDEGQGPPGVDRVYNLLTMRDGLIVQMRTTSIAQSRSALSLGGNRVMPGKNSRPFSCSFCGKHRDQVRKLVAGPGVYICDECVALCNEILSEPPPTSPGSTSSTSSSKADHKDVGPYPRGERWFRRLWRHNEVLPAGMRLRRG